MSLFSAPKLYSCNPELLLVELGLLEDAGRVKLLVSVLLSPSAAPLELV